MENAVDAALNDVRRNVNEPKFCNAKKSTLNGYFFHFSTKSP